MGVSLMVSYVEWKGLRVMVRSWLWRDCSIAQIIFNGSVSVSVFVFMFVSVSEGEVRIGVPEEVADVGSGFDRLGIVTIMGEAAIARCAASTESRMARIGRS